MKRSEGIDQSLMFRAALLLLAAIVVSGTPCHGSEPASGGVIHGVVVDQVSSVPLAGATVRLHEAKRAIAADSTGDFFFENVPIGTYRLSVSFLGYATLQVRDVRLTSADSTVELRLALIPEPVIGEPIVVRGARDPESDRAGTGTVVVTGETVSERPASLNDISRAVSGMVPVARFDDRYPSLIVRGGSAIENGFYVDNIPLPTINHFPSQGSGSGPLGIMSAHLIEDARFYAGGFPVAFGDRLSSVIDITLKQGSREEFSGVATVDVTGATMMANGPLPGGAGSYLVSARQGFLNLLLEMLDIDASPDYSDLHAKVTIDLDSLNSLTVLGLAGKGDFYLSEDISDDGGADFYGTTDYRSGTVGVNWDQRHPGTSRRQTSLSASHIKRNDDHFFTGTNHRVNENSSIDEAVVLRHAAKQRLSGYLTIHYGGEGNFRNADYHILVNPFNDEGGYLSDTIIINATEQYLDASVWLQTEWRLGDRVTIGPGVRYDRWGFAGHEQISLRGSIEYRVNETTLLYCAVGQYRQSLPLTFLLQHEENNDLENPGAVHAVVGFSRRFGSVARIALEAYAKDYEHMPMDSVRPTVFVLDELVYDYGFLPGHAPLAANGKAEVRGIEASVDLTLFQRLLLGVSGSLSRARYDDYHGVRRDRVIDNGLALDIESRYRPMPAWQISGRWVYGGGRPYTPYDMELTNMYNGAVFDYERANEERYRSYHSLSLRVQRQFTFTGSALTVYGEVWNAYDRENIAGRYWDSEDHRIETVHQFPRIPVLGVEYRF